MDTDYRPPGRKPTCQCGECSRCKHRAYMRQWYQRKTPEERRAWVAKRKAPRKRESLSAQVESVRRSVARYPEKNRARIAVHNAVARGKLTKQPCAECGATKVEGHHMDYAKPLEVDWLCRLHHVAAHRGF